MASSISGKADPVVRTVTVADIGDALAQGLRDFQRAPKFGLFFGAVYAAGGILILLCLSALQMTYLAYPLAAGFFIIGPFVALGLYQVSRDLESGTPLSFGRVLSIARSRREVGWMAFVTGFIFVIWMYQVRLLLALFLGSTGSFATLPEFFEVVLTTNEGLLFLIIGNLIGAAISLVLFSITVVSYPIILDRDVDFVTAMITSLRAVSMSPVPMLGWGVVIVVLLIVSSMPLFLGLLVTLPVLGHATWHLYRRIVVPDEAPAQVATATI